ncbi:hypothetical protein R1flu_011349 [Riccia fluitans]|uniref:Kazal-like domain-containing protein n=1 Tax=Riccia fluitans TaxID=41844 RepID=A0ABD1ZAS9_9MARC
MAAPCCRWVPLVVVLCLICTSAFATPVESSGELNNPWELPIVETICDSVTPVCGEGGIRFDSACHAMDAGVRIVNNDDCLQIKKPTPCNVKCFRADPVCGVDQVTYWCGAAEAKCANVEVAHTGFCDLKSGGPGEKGNRAAQSLFLVNLVWLALAGFLVIAGFP